MAELGAGLSDPASVHELLATAVERAGARLVDASLRSVHVRAGRSRSQVYDADLDVDGAPQRALLVAHADRRPLPDGAFALRRAGETVAVWRFPFDPYLRGLPSATDAGRVRELLDELEAAPGRVSLLTRAYRPSRRAVVEVTVAGRVTGRILYFKALSGDRATTVADIHRRLVRTLPVPRVVGVAPTQGIVALEALAGHTLRTALIDGLDLPDPDEIVELSDRFAASGVTSPRDPRAFADPARHVEVLASIAPERRADIERVAAAAIEVDGPLVGVHGDLHDGQLLLTGDHVTGVLDVDGAGEGLFVQDAGNLIAHVQVVGELWPQSASRCEAYAAALFDAYSSRVDARQLARATAGGWLGLATGPQRAQDPAWEVATRRRIDRACEALEQAG